MVMVMMRTLFLSLLIFLCGTKLDCLAMVYTVGGPAGWTTPSRARMNYTLWSSTTTFKKGDILEFNYVPKAHNVLEVTRTDFRYCNKTAPLGAHADASGKTRIELATPGNRYFMDGVGHHCEEGQKFQAKVQATPAPAAGGGGSVSSSPSAGDFAPAFAPSSISAFEPPSATPAIPPAAGDAPSSRSHSSIPLILCCLYLVLLSLPRLSSRDTYTAHLHVYV